MSGERHEINIERERLEERGQVKDRDMKIGTELEREKRVRN